MPKSLGPGDEGVPIDLNHLGPSIGPRSMIGGTSASEASPVAWTVDAAGRLERIPTFIRPMARQAIERFAQERGYATVTDEVMDQARDFMGM